MRFIHLYLIGYFVLVIGAGLALWQAGVVQRVSPAWLGISALIVIGLGPHPGRHIQPARRHTPTIIRRTPISRHPTSIQRGMVCGVLAPHEPRLPTPGRCRARRIGCRLQGGRNDRGALIEFQGGAERGRGEAQECPRHAREQHGAGGWLAASLGTEELFRSWAVRCRSEAHRGVLRRPRVSRTRGLPTST